MQHLMELFDSYFLKCLILALLCSGGRAEGQSQELCL